MCVDLSLEIAQEPTYRWVAGRLLSLASSLIAQPTRYRPLRSDVRASLAARVNRRVMATTYRVVDHYQSMEQQPSRPNKQRVTSLSVPKGQSSPIGAHTTTFIA